MFDGLFPEPHNTAVMELLFTMGHWHGLAKLRMHNDWTLDILDSLTTTLGKQLRDFNSITCSAFNTVELRREQQARLRRETKGGSVSSHSRPSNGAQLAPTQDSHQGTKGRRPKKLNINTYKFHSYGDYGCTIRDYGTTDSFSTEPVCVITVVA